jgi:hypothetical protein
MKRRMLLAFALPALLAVCGLAETTARPSSKGRTKRKTKARSYEAATTADEKLKALTDLKMTSAEIALAAGCSVRAIEERRRRTKQSSPANRKERISKTDDGIDALHSLVEMLRARKVPPHNVRAWFIGRSAYLDEQRPATLLGSGEFELVREAAIAYATSETPAEFRDRKGPIKRVPDPLGT